MLCVQGSNVMPRRQHPRTLFLWLLPSFCSHSHDVSWALEGWCSCLIYDWALRSHLSSALWQVMCLCSNCSGYSGEKKAFLTKTESITNLWAWILIFRRQLNRHIVSVYQNNNNRFPTRAYDIPSHWLLIRFSIPDVNSLTWPQSEGSWLPS